MCQSKRNITSTTLQGGQNLTNKPHFLLKLMFQPNQAKARSHTASASVELAWQMIYFTIHTSFNSEASTLIRRRVRYFQVLAILRQRMVLVLSRRPIVLKSSDTFCLWIEEPQSSTDAQPRAVVKRVQCEAPLKFTHYLDLFFLYILDTKLPNDEAPVIYLTIQLQVA